MKSQLSEVFVMCAHMLPYSLQEGKGRLCLSLRSSRAQRGRSSAVAEEMARAKFAARGLGASSAAGRSQAVALGISEDGAEFAVTEWAENWHHEPSWERQSKQGKICLTSLFFFLTFFCLVLPSHFELSPLQKGIRSCLFEPRERTPGQVDLRLLAKPHPHTDCAAHTRPYLAANGQPEEIPLNRKSQVFLLL